MVEDGHRISARENLKESVVHAIRQLIMSGQLRAGEKIDQYDLAERLGVSRLPVREALIVLENEGLVDQIARRGAFVASLTPQDIRDHYEIYGVISGLATRNAALRLSAGDIEGLRGLVRSMRADDDAERLGELCFQFHAVINRSGASRLLRYRLRTIGRTIPAKHFINSEGWPRAAREDHRRILRAIEARDAEGAGEAAVDHLRRLGQHAVDYLSTGGFWTHERIEPDESPGAEVHAI
jgi:DNA-binding GntR family transcriptional regulator